MMMDGPERPEPPPYKPPPQGNTGGLEQGGTVGVPKGPALPGDVTPPPPTDLPPPVEMPPLDMPPMAGTPTGMGGTFATPATPRSLTPFRSPAFLDNRVTGMGGGAMSPGVPLVGAGQGGDAAGATGDDDFRRAVMQVIASRR